MDDKFKRRRLERITDEVGELHPLLDGLLPKLAGISRVDYTHGPNEFGADFVLTKMDETLGDTEYIGVLAKVGDISQGSLMSEVMRQLEEIGVRRHALEGKKQIRVGETWVVTTGRFSNNAQDLISEKLPDKKVKFVDGERLAQLIDHHADYFWHNINSGIGSYLSDLRLSVQALEHNHDLVQVGTEPVYIEQDIFEYRQNAYGRKSKERGKRKRVDMYQLVTSEPFVLLEGGMGIGKSKLLRTLAKHFTSVEVYLEKAVLPVLSTVHDFFAKYRADPQVLLSELLGSEWLQIRDKARLLLILDGFDEFSGTGEEQIDRLATLQRVPQEVANCTVVVATRFLPTSVEDDWDDSTCKRVEISPLSLTKTLTFLTTLCERLNVATRLVEDLRRSQLFKELPRTPIAAILLAKLLNENSADLPSNLTELYSKYLELMLGRWDAEKGLQSQKEYQAAERVIMQVSKYMLDNSLTALTREDFIEFFRDYLSHRNLDLDAEGLANQTLVRSGIMREDTTTSNVFFAHRTFAEYFYAKHHFKWESLAMDNRAFQIYWANVYFFYLGLKEDCPDLLQEMMEIEPADESEFWIRLINIANYLLAARSSPYEVVQEIMPQVLIDAAKTYHSIVTGNRKTLFSFMPEIVLLWWTQAILRESFGYLHFKNAIDDSALSIASSHEADVVKAYALFFLSVVALELEIDDPFRFLLEDFHHTLPASLEFALYYEGKNMKQVDKVVRKQMKRARERMNALGSDLVERLHKTPITNREDLESTL
jgi:hypothetical protein